MRKPIMAGNWKMYKTPDEAMQFVESLPSWLLKETKVEMVICAPFVSLDRLGNALKETNVKLGAQNMYWENEGAFTGETSARMLQAVGCEYVVLGHSERRQFFGDTDLTVNTKVKKTLEVGLKPIMCVGETLSEREAGKTDEIVLSQVTNGLKDISLSLDTVENFIIAYEPVWAIGTGKICETNEANRVIGLIRKTVESLYNAEIANAMRILYGGSVKPENTKELLATSDIDGGLVGGASLNADSYSKLIENSI